MCVLCVFIPVCSEGGDTLHGAPSAALGVRGDQGLGLEAVFGFVLQIFQSQLFGAAVHIKHRLQRRGDRSVGGSS